MVHSKKWIVWTVVGLVLVLLIGLGVFGYTSLIKDNLPAAPVNYTDPKTLGTSIASDILLKNKAELTVDDFNGALAQAKDSINKSMNEKKTNFVIKDLFGDIREDDVVIYCRASINDFPVNALMEANLQFLSPDIEIVVKSVKVGDIKLPGRWVTGYLYGKKDALPENISVTGDRICYDTTSLNDLILETARKNEKIAKVEKFVSGVAEFFNKEFKTEDYIDFQIKGVEVKDHKITIKTSVFK